jgi:hypothetical protein
VSGLVMLGGTLVFAAQPVSRRWRSDPSALRPRGGALGSPALRTLILILIGVGATFGATEVGVIAATHALGSAAAAAPLLGLWGLGSLLGGAVVTRLGGSVRSARGLTILLAALALTHGALIFATGNVLALGVLITLAGSTIAPTVSSIYAMVDAAAPAGTETEAFSWLVTAELIGASLGAALGGALAQRAGAPAAFALVAAAGGSAALVSLLRAGAGADPDPDPGGCGSERQDVAEREPTPLDALTELARDRRVEDRSGVNERVELPVLTARVDRRREIGEQLVVETATGKRRIELGRIDAHEHSLEPSRDELPRKLCGVPAPDREHGLLADL